MEDYNIYIKPFRVASIEGVGDLHSRDRRNFDGGIAFIDTKTNAKRYKNVIYRSGSNITTDLQEFNLNEYSWHEIKEKFNDLPRPKIIGRIKLPVKKEVLLNSLESILKNYLVKHVGKDRNLRFIPLKS